MCKSSVGFSPSIFIGYGIMLILTIAMTAFTTANANKELRHYISSK